MRLAVISDIHGNLPALEAVLADVKYRGVDATVNLGDCVTSPPMALGRPLSFSNRLLYRLFGEIMIGGLKSFPTMTFPLQKGSHGMR